MLDKRKVSADEKAERRNLILAEFAQAHQAILRSKKVGINTDPISFQCSFGHNFKLSLRQIKRDSWCRFCRDEIPYNQAEAKNQLKKAGYELNSKFSFLGGEVKADCIECGDKRERPFNWLRDHPCQHAKKEARGALKRMQDAAAKLGGSLLSKKGRKLQEEFDWECEEGHHFRRTGFDVIHRQKWCTACEPTRVDIVRAKQLVEDRGGKLLTEGEINSKTRLSIICNLGHPFEKSWSEMASARAQWCDTCSSKSKSEEMARTVLEQVFGISFPKKRPQWLISEDGRRLELDGFNEELKVAFEYQGQQHFDTKGVYGGTEEQLRHRKRIDGTKRRLCRAQSIFLVEIAYTVKPEDFKEELHKELRRLEYPGIQAIDWSLKPDLNKAFIREDRLEELREAMAAKNLKLLSPKWIDVSTKYKYICLQCGDKNQKPGRSFLKSRGPDGCKKCAMKVTAQQVAERKLGIGRLEEIAKQFQAKLVSTEYLTVKDQYQWICIEGHEVIRTLDDVQNSGHLCTQCASTAPALKDLQQFAKGHGGYLLSERYSGVTTHYEWCCKNNHEFERTWPNMSSAKFFCPECGEKEEKISRMVRYAQSHGGECLAKEYFDVKHSYTWRCARGHEFTKSFERMLRNKNIFHGRCN